MKPPLKPAIIISPHTEASLARTRQHRAMGDAPRRSVAEMLSQLYVIAGEMLDELETADLPLAARLIMAEKAARLLPLLDKAERKSRTQAGGKAPEDMTDRELIRALKQAGAIRRKRAT